MLNTLMIMFCAWSGCHFQKCYVSPSCDVFGFPSKQ
uniref:Uncharacterized protein n=1 Tax=Arundo donax TaxID=35708 RepID=A0A0A8Z6M3_ARUDO